MRQLGLKYRWNLELNQLICNFRKSQLEETHRRDGVNIFISDSLGRFECQKNEASSPKANSAPATNCLELITIIEAQSLNATSGRIEEPIREGMFYLVIDNTGSLDAKQVRVSLEVIAD